MNNKNSRLHRFAASGAEGITISFSTAIIFSSG